MLCVCVLFGLVSIVSSSTATDWEDVTADHFPIATISGRTMDAEFADLDADGDPDLVLATEYGPNIVMLNDGEGLFTHAADAIPQKSNDSEDIAIADFDGDGDLDMIIVSEDTQEHELYLNNGDATFADASSRIGVRSTSNAVLAVDIDRDGDSDLVLGSAGLNAVLLNDGDAEFSVVADMFGEASRTTQDIESADLNDDGWADFVFANEDGNQIFLSDGSGGFEDASSMLPLLSVVETREIDVADLDGDGMLDLVLANVGWRPGAVPTNQILMRRGDRYLVGPAWPGLGAFTLDVDIVDVDGDGVLEILAGNVNSTPLEMLRFSSEGGPIGSLVPAGGSVQFDASPIPVQVIDVECVDVDGDGRLEIYICGHVGSDRLLSKVGG